MVKLKFLQDIWQVFIHKGQMLWLSMTRSWLSVKRKKNEGPQSGRVDRVSALQQEDHKLTSFGVHLVF